MANISLSVLLLPRPCPDLHVFFGLFLQEIQQAIVINQLSLGQGYIVEEGGLCIFGEGHRDDFDEFIVEDVVHLVVLEEVVEGGEKLTMPGNDFPGVESVLS